MPTAWPVFKSSVRPVQINIERFSGLNTATTAAQIDDNESPDLINITLDSQGRPDKRFGFERVFPNSLGTGKINGTFNFVRKSGTSYFLIHWGTTLYTQTGSDQPVPIYNGMSNNRSVFYAFNDYVWIMDGTNYLRCDGLATTLVSLIAYIPTVLVSAPPAGGGTPLEDFNLLGPGFRQSFSGNASATVYQLALTNLDALPLITALVNGTTIVEGAGLTVNRVTGAVTFSAAPSNGTNNVLITAYKTVAGKTDVINNCINYVIFGGTQDTRVFWYGNQNFPANIYRSGLYDPSYAPENGFIKVGSDASKVVNMVAQYDSCIIVKGNLQNAQTATQNVYDVLIWQLRFEISSNGSISFPVLPLNNQIDSIAKDSMQLINNAPTWLSSNGIQQLQGTNVKDERNTQHISEKIDRSADFNLVGLMESTNLVNSVSVDYDKKYILAIQDSQNTAFVYDYNLGVWLKWNNIKASCFTQINDYLYFGSNSEGMVYRLLKLNDDDNYQDDGNPINAYWKSKLLNFGTNAYLKTAPRMWFHLKPSIIASADVSYVTDQFGGSPVITSKAIRLFTYPTWNYAFFSYALSAFPSVNQVKIKAKKFMYLQIQLSNPRLNESMGIIAIQIDAQVVKMAK